MKAFPNHHQIMKKYFLALLLICLTPFFVSAQVNTQKLEFEPTLLILSPNKTSHEKSFNKEISDFNKSIPKTLTQEEKEEEEAYLSSSEFTSQSFNIQKIIKSEIEYLKKMDFFKQTSTISEQFLAYRFFEKFPNLLILLKDEKSNGSIKNLKKLSESEELQYVLNFSSIDIYKEANISYANVTVQLYDQVSNSILLNKSYIGDWYNPGFEFSCENETINCCLNNALSQMLNEIIYIIASNNPTLIREKQLQQERLEVLMSTYLTYKNHKQSLLNIFSGSNIDLDNAYQTLFNDNQTKFVTFFLEQISSQDLKSLTENKKDNNVTILTKNDIKDKEFLNEIPKNYAYIIKGVNYNNRWFYEKTKVTYFESETLEEGQKTYFNNLQKWNFFKENSIELNSDFWETKLFEKVPDLTKAPEWEEFGKLYNESEEINNRDFIGLYDIVANTFRKEKQERNTVFEKEITEQVFNPNYQLLKDTQPNKYSKISEHSLIFSKERNVAINPILVTDSLGLKKVHYFVAFKGSPELYEWTYFEPLHIEGNLFGSEVVDQISSITEWNFSVDNLNDEEFWEKFVLLKIQDDYKYLKLIDQDSKTSIQVNETKPNQVQSTIKKSNKKVLFLIDGKEISEEDLEKIDPNDIEEITVIKNKELISNYTTEDYDGVVIIKLKKT